MSGVFNSPHGQKGGEKGEKGGKRRKLKIAETASEARKQKQEGKKAARNNTFFSLSFTHSVSATELSLLYFLQEIEME
jgi:hypothetical protein